MDLTEERLPRVSWKLLALGLVAALVVTIAIVGGPWLPAPDTESASAPLPPVVPGLHGRHPLDVREVGALLIGELGCAACHPQLEAWNPRTKAAPSLEEVGGRVSPEFLRSFLADPGAAQAGTTMPQVLSGVSPEKREGIADALSQFLISRSSTLFRRGPIDEDDIGVGGELFHKVGCVACHAPREVAMLGSVVPVSLVGAVALAHLPEKYSLASLSQFLHQPLSVRSSGRMPAMGLSSAEARSIASYLLGTKSTGAANAPVNRSLIEAGRGYFQEFNCAACHPLEGAKALPLVGVQDRLDPMRGCLSQEPEGAPDFSLSDDQRAAIRKALLAGVAVRSADEQIAATLTAFNCIGCHVRDDYGGVRAEIDLYFKTSEPSLGDHARIPPPLTEAGAKLNPEWFHRVMFDAASVRPYMHTRMPQFGEANLASLASLLESADPAVPFEMAELKGDEARDAREAGRLLLGADTLGCINCHTFNGKKSPAFSGIDLITSVERLRPAWFSRFLIDPQAFRPGIIMPQGWPGGLATRSDVLEGDSQAQIDGIWLFLEQGRTARDPQGIRSEPSILTVSDTTRTYRGRSRIAGFRGIAVGFPNGMSYAFNAHTGSLSGIWQGGFVRVRWDGQGAGDFDPASRAIALAQDVGLCRLANDEAPWPLRPQMDEENPVNPDPLYPRNLGYHFGGYFFDEASVPTFMYRVGGVAIEDTSAAEPSGDSSSLARSIRFSSPAVDTLYLRVLTGKIKEISALQFRTDALQLTIPPTTTLLRRLPGAGEDRELILKIEIPQGDSTMMIRYEVL